ncbi:hypothetical protein MVEN_02204000 [Mycena venus]|uniref:DUF6535 domain-containing protein n=1 Tax=Mycena venus TaxID=2733690 RepID=A0A8H7CHD6_9AGAR|nr:hypothetical protein MVEN_02204000 [Mycena venus]
MSSSAAPSQGIREGDTIPPEEPPANAELTNEKPEEAIELPAESNNDNTNRLVGAINEQSAILKTALERVRSVTTAVEALKQQPQSPDKKIAFWTAYKKLADEFDTELQAKYGQDLDTSFNFCLFSAVSSAFIIQIQPELQPDPNGPTQALLSLLVQNITGLPLAALPPGISPSPPPTIVIVAQSLLYFSLSATLLAALLAVLGKQWLLHYNSVGERGTIEECGLERQCKVDGMQRWRFDLVMQVFPLLLQFALLLFATALAIYLWTIHHAIAAIALSLTGLGSILYTAMIISAVASPDSPFQTSLSSLLKIILDQFPIPSHLHQFVQGVHGAITQMALLLPLFHSSKPPELVPLEPVPIFDPPDSRMNEAQAVLWALEASTDPSDSELKELIFADFLFCLNSFFVPTIAQDHTLLDKSEYSTLLVALLFENLIKRLTDLRPLDYGIANDIVIKVSQIADKVSFTVDWHINRCVEAGYRFCALPGVSQEAIRSALQLVASNSVWELREILSHPNSLSTSIDITWLFKTLEWVGSLNSGSNTRILGDLWQALFLLPFARDTLPMESIRVLLSALPTEEDDWDRAYLRAHLACAILDSTDHWFAEDELCPILQQPSVWANLGQGGDYNWSYYSLGNKLSQHPGWTEIISSDLPGWLLGWPGIISDMSEEKKHQVNFRSVLSRVWNGDEAEANDFGEEATRVMVFNALTSTWNQADFSDWGVNHVGHHINLLDCTVSAVFAAWMGSDGAGTPSQRFKDTILVRLGEALARAGERMKHELSNSSDVQPDLKDTIDRLADLLSRLALLIQGNLGTPEQAHTAIDLDYWWDLRNTWRLDAHALRQAIDKAKLGESIAMEKTI